jgi:hypothetical protein
MVYGTYHWYVFVSKGKTVRFFLVGYPIVHKKTAHPSLLVGRQGRHRLLKKKDAGEGDNSIILLQ